MAGAATGSLHNTALLYLRHPVRPALGCYAGTLVSAVFCGSGTRGMLAPTAGIEIQLRESGMLRAVSRSFSTRKGVKGGVIRCYAHLDGAEVEQSHNGYRTGYACLFNGHLNAVVFPSSLGIFPA
ncbi:hypothetical protein CCHOA_00790 [Corynebacterium choanae]|uniref:Uncharacterized protein n=1 Tax=Corynebacterium choanae TaxID=1862358 RepID=A0A3G6J3J4_9CORY|nr:hypothetical protein CCHOA_00790 [Corynebacterium choanae]